MNSIIKNPRKIFNTSSGDSTIPGRVTILENNEYKVTYYEIVSGASGSLTIPTGATINAGEFGLSGNAILSKIDGSNKPTFESPKTAGGVVVTTSLNVVTGAWVASDVYTDTNVAVIYSLKIKAIDYSNLTYFNIIDLAVITDAPTLQTVTDAGAITTNAVEIQNNLTVTSRIYANLGLNLSTNTDDDGEQIKFVSLSSSLLKGTNVTAQWIWELPNKNGTFAVSVNGVDSDTEGNIALSLTNIATISTGLTLSGSTLTANLSTGVVGGQSVIGGTASGNNLTLSSTSHATKGAIMLGASSEYDEANKRLGINTITPTAQIESRFDAIGATAPTIAQSLFLSNETLATVGTQQYSPAIYWGGAGWRNIATTTSQPIKFRNYLVTIAGTNATGTLTWESSLNGAAYSNIMSLTAAGALTIGGNLSCNSVLASSVLRAGSASQIYWNTRSQMFSPADGIIQLTDAAATDFNRLQLGGTTSAFPSIKRSGANIALRLANDSADTGLIVSGINVSAETASKVATFDASKNLKSSSVSTTELINTIVECGLNVLNYGLTGNGVTDDRAALNTLLTNATTGATIYFPPGTYLIGSNIAISNKQFNFVGAGGASIIKISANTQILNISSTAALASKWSFSDLVFEGSGAGGNQAALYFSNNSGSFSINRCTFRSFGYAGIAVANTETSDVLGGLISSCKFYSNNIAIDCSVGTRGEYVQILNSDFYSNTKAIVTNSGNLIISNNNINFNGTAIESITGTNNGHFIINGNNINHNTSFGLNISNTTLGLTISNNHIYQSPISIVSTSGVNIIGGQIDVTAYTLTSNTGLIFSNVRFDSGYTNTITLTGTAPIYTNCFKMNGDIAVTAASFVTLASNPSATFVSNAGTTITSTDTFDGFTLAQIVRQLKNRGQIS